MKFQMLLVKLQSENVIVSCVQKGLKQLQQIFVVLNIKFYTPALLLYCINCQG